jgi:hypothetical protein
MIERHTPLTEQPMPQPLEIDREAMKAPCLA